MTREMWNNIEKLSELRSKYSCFDEEEEPFYHALSFGIKAIKALDALDKIKAEIEQLPTKTRTNWDGCCPDIDYPQIEYVDVTKNKLLSIIDKFKAESEVKKA